MGKQLKLDISPLIFHWNQPKSLVRLAFWFLTVICDDRIKWTQLTSELNSNEKTISIFLAYLHSIYLLFQLFKIHPCRHMQHTNVHGKFQHIFWLCFTYDPLLDVSLMYAACCSLSSYFYYTCSRESGPPANICIHYSKFFSGFWSNKIVISKKKIVHPCVTFVVDWVLNSKKQSVCSTINACSDKKDLSIKFCGTCLLLLLLFPFCLKCFHVRKSDIRLILQLSK